MPERDGLNLKEDFVSHHFRPLLVSALILSSAACSSENPAGPASDLTILANKSSGPVTRPAGGKCTTSFAPISFVYPLATLEIYGVCKLKNLGHSTMYSIQILDVRTGEITNTTTYTADNGDELQSTFAGTSSPPPNVEFQGTETYGGGTGQFAGATGSSQLKGSATANPDFTGTGKYTTKGSITF